METEQMVACPRCGSDPELVRVYDNSEITMAQCSNENCGHPSATGRDKAMARKLWNIRAGGRKPAMPETVGVKALASATGSAASSKESGRDELDCAPYWLCYALAEYVCAINETCEREPFSCAQSSLCITEWCAPCAALAWLNEQKRLSAPLPPNAKLTDAAPPAQNP